MQNTLINGSRYAFSDVSVNMAGIQLPPGVFQSIDYKATQTPGIIQGNQVAPVGRTSGYGEASGSFSMLISEFDDFAAALLGVATAPSIMSADFQILVSMSVNLGADHRTDILNGCRITDVSITNTKGSDATIVTCSLSIMQVLLNGLPTFSQGDR